MISCSPQTSHPGLEHGPVLQPQPNLQKGPHHGAHPAQGEDGQHHPFRKTLGRGALPRFPQRAGSRRRAVRRERSRAGPPRRRGPEIRGSRPAGCVFCGPVPRLGNAGRGFACRLRPIICNCAHAHETRGTVRKFQFFSVDGRACPARLVTAAGPARPCPWQTGMDAPKREPCSRSRNIESIERFSVAVATHLAAPIPATPSGRQSRARRGRTDGLATYQSAAPGRPIPRPSGRPAHERLAGSGTGGGCCFGKKTVLLRPLAGFGPMDLFVPVRRSYFLPALFQGHLEGGPGFAGKRAFRLARPGLPIPGKCRLPRVSRSEGA